MHIVKAVGIFILSFLVFYVAEGIPSQPYLFIAILAVPLLLLCYYNSPGALLAFILYLVINAAGFVVANIFLHQGFEADSLKEFVQALFHCTPISTRRLMWAYIVVLVAISFYCVLRISITYWRRRITQPLPTPLPIQEYTLARLSEYLETFDTIGLCGSWGSGKTFLVNEFVRRSDNENSDYRFIYIETLSCNLDEIQDIILHEIDKIMLSCGVFSQYSKRFGEVLGRTGWGTKFKPLIMGDASSFTRTLKNIGDEVKEIGKTIVIIFEDIERIAEKKMIQKVFGISALISCRHIKIIYQCDMAVLKGKDDGGFSQRALEKYIPHTIIVPTIDFADAIVRLLDKDADIEAQIVKGASNRFTIQHMRSQGIQLPWWHRKKKLASEKAISSTVRKGEHETKEKLMDLVGVNKSDFAYITDDKIKFRFGDKEEDVFPRPNKQIDLSRATMRTIKNFLREAIQHLSVTNRDIKNIKRTIITTILVKHFYDSIYASFELNRGKRFRLLDNLIFTKGTGTAHAMSILINNSHFKSSEVQNILSHKSEQNIQMGEALRLYDHSHVQRPATLVQSQIQAMNRKISQ